MTKILSLRASNFKAISVVGIDTNGENVILSGKNGSGKTSTMDAIWAALQNSKASKTISNPIKNGEADAVAVVELDNYIVTRKWNGESGRSSIVITDKEGNKQTSPQTILDNIIGDLSFDPQEFSSMNDKPRYEVMLSLSGVNVDEHDAIIKAAYDERTIANRKVKDLVSQGRAMPRYDDSWPTERVSISELNKELNDLREHKDTIRKFNNYALVIENSISQTSSDIAQIKSDIEALQLKLSTNLVELETLKDIKSSLVQPSNWSGKTEEVILSEINNFEDLNKKADDRAKYLEMKESYDRANEEALRLTEAYEAAKKAKLDALVDANYPIDGLFLDADSEQVMYKGVPWGDLSTGERLKTATAMAMAMNPDLKVIFLRDASLLDDDSITAIKQMACDGGYQIWMEIVNSDDPTALQFIDGAIEGQDPSTVEIPEVLKRVKAPDFMETVEDNPFDGFD